MEEFGLQDVSDVPGSALNLRTTNEEMQKFFSDCCKKVVASVWHKMNLEEVTTGHGTLDHEGEYPFCYCEEDHRLDVPMVGCSVEQFCREKEWYHIVSTDQCIRKKILMPLMHKKHELLQIAV